MCYEQSAVKEDRIKNVVITSPVKYLLSINARDLRRLPNASSVSLDKDTLTLTKHDNFEIPLCCIPLRMLTDFAKEYKRIQTNVKQKFILLGFHRPQRCNENIRLTRIVARSSGT